MGRLSTTECTYPTYLPYLRLFLSEVARQSSQVRWGILLMSHRWGSVAP